jgi:hypothetical protein
MIYVFAQQAVADLEMMRKLAEQQQQQLRDGASIRENSRARRDKQVKVNQFQLIS